MRLRLEPGVELMQKPITHETLATRVRDVLDMPSGGGN
jgi:hypothetical protein